MESVWEFAKKVPGLREEILRWNLERIAKRTKLRVERLEPFTDAKYNRITEEMTLDLGKIESIQDLRGVTLHELTHAAGLGELGAWYVKGIVSKERMSKQILAAIGAEYVMEKAEILERIYRTLGRIAYRFAAAGASLSAASMIASTLGHPSLSSALGIVSLDLFAVPVATMLHILRRPPNKEFEKLLKEYLNYGEVRFLRWFRKRGRKLGIEPTKENYERFVGDREDAFRDLFLLSTGMEKFVKDPYTAYEYAYPGWLNTEVGRKWVEEVSSNPELAEGVLSRGPKIPRWFFKEKLKEERSNKLLSFLRRRLNLREQTKLQSSSN